MAILSDFVSVMENKNFNVQIGDGNNENGWTEPFRTGSRRADRTAYITFMVKGMTLTNENANVFINDRKVGVLFNNKGGNPNHWQTQTIALSGSDLNDGENVLRVEPVTNAGTSGGTFDDFFIRNVYCHFHQNS